MTNFSREWIEEIVLPDGTTATSAADVDRYMRQNGVVLASDYSKDYYRTVRWKKQQREKDEAFKCFVEAYKRSVWCND